MRDQLFLVRPLTKRCIELWSIVEERIRCGGLESPFPSPVSREKKLNIDSSAFALPAEADTTLEPNSPISEAGGVFLLQLSWRGWLDTTSFDMADVAGSETQSVSEDCWLLLGRPTDSVATRGRWRGASGCQTDNYWLEIIPFLYCRLYQQYLNIRNPIQIIIIISLYFYHHVR